MLFRFNDKKINELIEALDGELEHLSDALYKFKAYKQHLGKNKVWQEQAAAVGLDPAIDFMLPADASIEEKLMHMLAEIRTINKRLK